MAQPMCPVTFFDGSRCTRPRYHRSPWCRACADWSRRHAGTDPDGRRAYRKRGTLRLSLEAAATTSTNECVILSGRKGRGTVEFEGRKMNAARAVWWIANGDPGELHVLHTCHRGNEGCINIKHLKLGTNQDNIRDMVEAGRRDGWRSALTDEQVSQIRRRYIRGNRWHPGNSSQLATEYGVTEQHITAIARRKFWPDLTMPEPRPHDSSPQSAVNHEI